MQNSKTYLHNKGILPKISFKDGQSHLVKLLKDKEETIRDANGLEKQGIKYLVEEGGTPKSFFTSSIGLVQKLSELAEGTEVVIQMKSKKGDKGFISYFEVEVKGQEIDIPIINAEEQGIPAEEF